MPRKYTVDANGSLLDAVMKSMGYHYTTKGRSLIKSGFVALDGKVCRIPANPVTKGMVIEVEPFDKSRVSRDKTPFPFEVLMDTEEFVAFVKPAGLPILDDRGKGKSVQRILTGYLERVGEEHDLLVVSKLDPPCSGILIACKDVRHKSEFEEAFYAGSARFYGLVCNRVVPPDGTWEAHFKRGKDGVLTAGKPAGDAREGKMAYRTLNGTGDITLLKLTPETTLRHQERALCAMAGNPLVGDRRYGAQEDPFGKVGLHLFSLDFTTPKGDKVSLKTPVPRHYLNCVKTRK